ncbi:MAG: helix-turn-helix domain-containing protein [Actinophytocola sp.]|nr:helix-turn-helix domain-containing protein [Actinophytocola sp.]
MTNGLALLSLVASTARPHGVTELARMAGLPKSHVHRLLQSLVAARYLEKDAQSRYRISVGALRLGRELLRSFPIRRAALPEMMRLIGEDTRVSLVLAVPFGHEAISIAHLAPDGNLRDVDTLGSVLSAHSSASGKLFLAHLPDTHLDEVLPRLEFNRQGPNTHPDAASLKTELPLIRQRGYSVNNCENGPSTIGVAVPIRNREGEVIAALGASARTDASTVEHLEEMALVLQKSSQGIELSYETEDETEAHHRDHN